MLDPAHMENLQEPDFKPVYLEPLEGGVNAVINEIDKPEVIFDDEAREEITQDILRHLEKAPSVDLYMGLVSGVCVRTGMVDESRVGKLVTTMRQVYEEDLGGDVTHKISAETGEDLAELQGELLDKERAAAEVLLTAVLRERANPKVKYQNAPSLNRFFLLTVARLG